MSNKYDWDEYELEEAIRDCLKKHKEYDIDLKKSDDRFLIGPFNNSVPDSILEELLDLIGEDEAKVCRGEDMEETEGKYKTGDTFTFSISGKAFKDSEGNIFYDTYIKSSDGSETLAVSEALLDGCKKVNVEKEKAEEAKKWPSIGDKYYCIVNGSGDVLEVENIGSDYDKFCIANGNYFKTRKDAQNAADAMKMMFRVIHGAKELDDDSFEEIIRMARKGR